MHRLLECHCQLLHAIKNMHIDTHQLMCRRLLHKFLFKFSYSFFCLWVPCSSHPLWCVQRATTTTCMRRSFFSEDLAGWQTLGASEFLVVAWACSLTSRLQFRPARSTLRWSLCRCQELSYCCMSTLLTILPKSNGFVQAYLFLKSVLRSKMETCIDR